MGSSSLGQRWSSGEEIKPLEEFEGGEFSAAIDEEIAILRSRLLPPATGG